jgi:phage-related protein
MATIQLQFNTLVLGDANNITIARIEIKDSKSITVHNIPVIDGTIAEEAKLGAKTITIEGDIAGTSHDDLRTNLDALRAGLQGLHKFTTDNERYIMAQFRDFSYSYVSGLTRLAKWSASFVAHFPFWLSETLHSDTRTPTSGVGYTLANAGNAPTRCKVTVTAPGGGITDDCQIENLTAGTTTIYRGTIVGYDSVIINNRVDVDLFEVLNDAVDDIKNFEGDFIILQPGNNTIEYTGTANAIVKFEWRDCWY